MSRTVLLDFFVPGDPAPQGSKRYLGGRDSVLMGNGIRELIGGGPMSAALWSLLPDGLRIRWEKAPGE